MQKTKTMFIKMKRKKIGQIKNVHEKNKSEQNE